MSYLNLTTKLGPLKKERKTVWGTPGYVCVWGGQLNEVYDPILIVESTIIIVYQDALDQ